MVGTGDGTYVRTDDYVERGDNVAEVYRNRARPGFRNRPLTNPDAGKRNGVFF